MLKLLKFSYKMGVVQMNCCCKKSDLSLIKPVLDEYGDIKGSLITVLQQAQDIYGYLPTDVLYCIAERIGVSPAKVMGVATFYSQFRLKPVGKYLIMLCVSCQRFSANRGSHNSGAGNCRRRNDRRRTFYS